MTLLEQIDALPEWPKRAEYIAHHEAQGTMVAEPGDYWHDALDAALARLALARIHLNQLWQQQKADHTADLYFSINEIPALLDALEVPR